MGIGRFPEFWEKGLSFADHAAATAAGSFEAAAAAIRGGEAAVWGLPPVLI